MSRIILIIILSLVDTQAAAPMNTRPRIYQLLPRLFGNLNETRKPNGTLAENGVGKFADIDDKTLASLRDELSITHLWLTGVLAQATSAHYPDIGKPADDPVLLKGLAGSPYAIKDYGDVCPDYAIDPANRIAEFRALITRAHNAGLKILIDFVPNHVARSHTSTVVAFGQKDDPTHFFAPTNNFFWLQHDSHGGGPPLRLPPGTFDPEKHTARVTGNNAATWTPSRNDWYETVKLNYGFDFTTGHRSYHPTPDTWHKMDTVLAHWQTLGVDGFRCDMAHMVPPEFWQWAVPRARARQPSAYFVAEAYNNDPMKVDSSQGKQNVMTELLQAGFDAVYDDPTYKALKRIYEGPAWANDLDSLFHDQHLFHHSLRYAENHDEVRIASPQHWGNHGPALGLPISAILWSLGRGPALIYSGQELGEPATGAEGFGSDDGRTTIFDYWSLPTLIHWRKNTLTPEQQTHRKNYGKLLHIIGQPAFRDGTFQPLNPHNINNDQYGRLPGEPASGHWLYTFLRATPEQRYLITVNLHPTQTLRDIRIHLPAPIHATPTDRYGTATATIDPTGKQIQIPQIPPLTPALFELLNAPTK